MEISGTITLTGITITAPVPPPPPPPPPPPAGALYVWGNGASYKLGTGTQYAVSSPVQVGSGTTWITTASTADAGAAIKSDGTLWTWGEPYLGQNGQNGNTVSVPTQLGSDTTWTQVAAGNGFMGAIKDDGSLWMWGANDKGQLGQGAAQYDNRSSPVQVSGTWSAVALGRDGFTLGIKTDGSLWGWGNNGNGQCGVPFTGSYKPSPVQVGTAFGGTPLYDWQSVATGAISSLAINTSGKLFAWGANNVGQLGLGNDQDRYSPTQVGTGTTWAEVAGFGSSTIARKTDGTLWSWGYNNVGQLGTNNTTPRSSPVQIGSGATWNSIATGSYSESVSATRTDGTLWAWGRNNQGQLGINNTTACSSPVQVGAATDWFAGAGTAGKDSMFGIRIVA